MKVKKLMTEEVEFCHLEDDLTKAVEIMWRRDCGVVPVIDGNGSVVGMITDRDISIAAASRNQKLSEIKIGEVIANGNLVTCSPDEDVEDALKKMRRKQIKRLSVVSKNGALTGILSITDILLKDKKLKKKVFSALKAIAKPRPIVLDEIMEEPTEN
jgi:CBS domain-containing protein